MQSTPDINNYITSGIDEVQFSDIFNLEELQNFQDLFADVHGVASIITTIDGRPITNPSNFSRFCKSIIRTTEKGRARCYQSDAVIGCCNFTDPIIQPCLSGGLWDAGASITVGGKHIANWLIGQVRTKDIDEERMIRYADEIGADRSEFMKALNEVPVMSMEQFNKIAKMLFAFANELSEKAYNNYQLKTEVAERKKVTEALILSEGRYRSVLTASPDNITITDLGGHIEMISDVGLKMFGYEKQEDLQGHLITDFLVPEDKERAFLNITLMFQGTMTGPGEYRGLRCDGSTLEIEANAEFIKGAEGQPIHMVFIIRDITERKQAEIALRQSEEEYRLLAENASDVIWTMDLQGNYLYISPSVFNMRGYTSVENMKQSFDETLTHESAQVANQSLKEASERILAGERPDPLILILEQICRNGLTVWTEIVIDAVYDDAKNFKNYIGVTRDVSKRINAENALRKSENQKAAILRAIPDLLLVLNQNGDYKEVYSGDGSRFSLAGDILIGRNVRELFPSDMANKFIESFRKSHNNKELEQLSYSMNVNGNTEFYEARIVPASDGNVLAIIRDITENSLAKTALAQQNDSLLKLNQFSLELSSLSSGANLEELIAKRIKEFTGASVVVFSEYRAESRNLIPKHVEMESGLFQKVMNLIGVKIEKIRAIVNDEVYKMMTRDIVAIYNNLTEPTFGVISPVVGVMIQKLIKADRFIGVTFLVEGEVYGTSLIALGKQPDPSMEMLKNFVFLAAVSLRRKRAEEQLQLSDQTYRGILDSITEAVYIEDKNGLFLDVNKAAEKMYGYSKNEFLGQTPEFLSAKGRNDLSKIKNHLEKSLKGKPQSFEFWGQRKDGTNFPKDINTSLGYYFGKKVNITVARDITQRKQSEEKIAMLAHAIRNISESVCITDMNDNILFVNSAFLTTYQYAEHELIGNSINIVRSPNNSGDVIKDILPSTISNGWQGELLNRRKDGSEFSVFLSTSVIYDENRVPIATTGIATDITERKQAEKELKNLRKAIENSSEAVFLTDKEGIFTFVNPGFTAIYGYSAEETIGKVTPNILKNGLINDDIYESFWLTMNNGQQDKGEFMNKRKDGVTIIIEGSVSAILDENSNIVGYMAIQRDITQRKRSEEELCASETFLKETQVIASLGTYSLDVSNGRWSSSELLDHIFGIDSGFDTSVEGWISIIHPEWQEIMDDYFTQEVIGKKKRFDKEYKIIRQNDKEIRWVHGIGNLKFDGNNLPVLMVGTIQDITKSKMAEFELIKAKEHAEESDRLKSAFLANMSHEIRTPMNGILGFAGLLKEPNLSGEDQQEYIQIIEKSGARMLNIINDIMSISKVESGQMEISILETNINEQIKYLYTFFNPEVEGKGIHLIMKTFLTTKEAVIKTDKEKVYAILTNLIKNAIKFTNSGFIEFGYCLKSEKKPFELEFYVKDTGMGICEEQISFIFERFRQGSESLSRNYEGAGLGLSISKAYVEMLGGKIWVESKVGVGSVFYFTIPYNGDYKVDVNNNFISMEITNNHINLEISGLKILIAEDDEGSAKLIAMSVRSFSKEIIKVRTGIEAVEACRNNPDIDLILMDIKMPDMDGFDATRSIRQFNQNVIIIAQTAYALAGDREKTMASGCNDYISKPIQKDQFMILIRKYFKN